MAETEPPQNILQKPRRGWRTFLVLFLIVFAGAFTGLFSLAFFCHSASTVSEEFFSALAVAALLAFLVVAGLKLLGWINEWRNFKRLAIVGGALFSLLALAVIEEDVRGYFGWTSLKHYLESHGSKLSLAALAPPTVPDEQNFALTPLLRPALEVHYTSDGITRWSDTNGYDKLMRFQLNLTGRDAHQINGLPSEGTFPDLEFCRNLFRTNSSFPHPDVPGTVAEDVLTALQPFDSGLGELHEAAINRPYSRFPIDYSYEPAAYILLPHLAAIKGISQIVQLRAQAHLAAGKPDLAFDDLKLVFHLSDSIKDEPFLIDHLVRIPTLDMGLQVIREGIVRHVWKDAQLLELENYLATLNVLAEFKNAMRGEQCGNLDNIDFVRKGGIINFDESEDPPARVRPFFRLLLAGYFYQNMRTIAEFHQKYTFPAIDEQARRIHVEIVEAGAQTLANWRARGFIPYKIYAEMLLPSLSTADVRSGHSQTFVDCARVACALERYRLANGRSPETLASLVPQYLPAIPHDVIDGQPLRYKTKSDDSYLIYSIGWNQVDEGGKLGWFEGKTRTVDNRLGDWVWFSSTPPH